MFVYLNESKGEKYIGMGYAVYLLFITVKKILR